MSTSAQIQIMAQEVIRRLRNTDRQTPTPEIKEILEHFMCKLYRSKYSQVNRLEILSSGVRGFLELVRSERKGGRRVNRPRTADSDRVRRRWKI